MTRTLPIAAFAAVCLGLGGCAGFWDTVSSRSFRKDPVGTVAKAVHPDDPVDVLLADPPRSGDDRAKAMRRLKEPTAAGHPQEIQDAVVEKLGHAATADPSPVVRLAAIEALGKFDDPRAGSILIVAYDTAHGRPPGAAAKARDDVAPAGMSAASAARMMIASRLELNGPTGYPTDTVAAVRCRVLESLGRTGRPEAVMFLSAVATGNGGAGTPDGSDDRDVRLAAVRGLGRCRQPEAVAALADVMARESAGKGRDGAVIGRAHDGLVRLTGKKLPAEPGPWNEVVQAGNIEIAPEPGWVQTAVGWVIP